MPVFPSVLWSSLPYLEKYLCEKFPADAGNVVQVGTMVHIFVDGSVYFQKARDLIPAYSPLPDEGVDTKIEKRYREDLKFMTAALFLGEKVPKDLNYELLKGLNLTFIISFQGNDLKNEVIALPIVPESLDKLIKILEPKHFEMARRYGANAMYSLNDYFKIY
jgi:hypothetical protein